MKTGFGSDTGFPGSPGLESTLRIVVPVRRSTLLEIIPDLSETAFPGISECGILDVGFW